jgi:hypothetical protein
MPAALRVFAIGLADIALLELVAQAGSFCGQ